MKIKKIGIFIMVIIVVIFIVIFLKLNNLKIIENLKKTVIDKAQELTEVTNFNNQEDTYQIEIKDLDNGKIYNNMCEIILKINNFKDVNKYFIEWNINGTNTEKIEVTSKIQILNLDIGEKEEKKIIYFKIYKNNNLEKEEKSEMYFIKKYNKQYLDEMSTKGTNVHYLNGSWEKYEKTADLLNYCGIKNIRTTFSWKVSEIDNKNDIFDFKYYDKWVEKLTNDGINIVACFNQIDTYGGEDKKINTNEEMTEFLKYVKKVFERYPQIKEYEIINQPNYNSIGFNKEGYVSDENLKWYADIVKNISEEAKKLDKDYNIIAGGTYTEATKDTDKYLTSKTFQKRIDQNNAYKYYNSFSYHPYDWKNLNIQNAIFNNKLKEHKETFNEQGGFIKNYITEYGISSYTGINVTENIQAEKLVQETIIIDEYHVDYATQYNFWNKGKDKTNNEDNFGLITNDYLPKQSYYAMKNYYENTNGSEYIGTVDIADDLESHVYNKDGKPKIIAWSNKSDKNIEIEYKDFEAKDIYGNNIENTNGKITITTSPVYLDNISEKYYYMAISKTAIEKYNEFETKYAEEIKQVTNLNTNIQTMKRYMTEVGNVTLGVPEESSKTAIEQHYALGKSIIDAYKTEELKIEHVKLSSMLDAIDDIGNAYEDLVTVSAKTRNADLDKSKKQIEEVENILKTNTDLEIIYPSKILEFSKDHYDKATYINGLEEENDIKTGVIVSKNIHSIELSKWAKEFSEIYVDEHIKSNPVTVNYSQTEITNQDIQATLDTADDSKIDNNNGNKEYTFKENGEFTFEYTRRGKNLKEKVIVKNIDKKAPEIKGVEQWKVYTGKALPIITDENLEKIELILNGQTVNEYKEGAEITEEGIYQIIATDKAGNNSRVNFEVIDNIDKGYKIENGFIKNITGSTKKEDFEKQLPIKYKYTIKRNDKELDVNVMVATGDILETEGNEKYTLIINGDINKDGIVSISDLIKVKREILGEIKLEGIEKQAADANQDGKEIGIKDLVRIRILILSRGF